MQVSFTGEFYQDFKRETNIDFFSNYSGEFKRKEYFQVHPVRPELNTQKIETQ